jgi:hypothetical protein
MSSVEVTVRTVDRVPSGLESLARDYFTLASAAPAWVPPVLSHVVLVEDLFGAPEGGDGLALRPPAEPVFAVSRRLDGRGLAILQVSQVDPRTLRGRGCIVAPHMVSAKLTVVSRDGEAKTGGEEVLCMTARGPVSATTARRADPLVLAAAIRTLAAAAPGTRWERVALGGRIHIDVPSPNGHPLRGAIVHGNKQAEEAARLVALVAGVASEWGESHG